MPSLNTIGGWEVSAEMIFFSKKTRFFGGEGIIFKNAERHHLENGMKKVCTKFQEATPMGKTSKIQTTILFEKTRFFGVFLGGRHNFEKRRKTSPRELYEECVYKIS